MILGSLFNSIEALSKIVYASINSCNFFLFNYNDSDTQLYFFPYTKKKSRHCFYFFKFKFSNRRKQYKQNFSNNYHQQ